ncbi:MAG TPA: aminotransferase class III-fold pyridoxal phosphate-dependent enzyme, partial [Edaphobacter sp.]
LDIIEREGMKNTATVGTKMLERLGPWVKKYAHVGDVRGRGLMIGVEIVKDHESREPAATLRDRIVELAFERGLLILGCGETSIRLCPPLIVNEHEGDVALDILEESLQLAAKR